MSVERFRKSPSWWVMLTAWAVVACKSGTAPGGSAPAESATASAIPSVPPRVPSIAPSAAMEPEDDVGAGHGCTNVACGDQATISLQPTLRTRGLYTFTISADRKTTTCQRELPRDGALVVGPKDLPCALLLRLSAMHSTVTVEGTPRVITIDAKRGATRVAHARVQPKYEAYYPNGKGCDPKCLQAEARIATVAP